MATRQGMYYQHDEVFAHYSRQVTRYLNVTFPEQWIGRGVPIHWPPRFPDLTPLDFSLWGWMKCEVYKDKVNTRDELVVRIIIVLPLLKNAKTLKEELLSRELKNALKSVVGLLNNFFELLQFFREFYIINVFNKCNQ